jgi:hypothetical protein
MMTSANKGRYAWIITDTNQRRALVAPFGQMTTRAHTHGRTRWISAGVSKMQVEALESTLLAHQLASFCHLLD